MKIHKRIVIQLKYVYFTDYYKFTSRVKKLKLKAIRAAQSRLAFLFHRLTNLVKYIRINKHLLSPHVRNCIYWEEYFILYTGRRVIVV